MESERLEAKGGQDGVWQWHLQGIYRISEAFPKHIEANSATFMLVSVVNMRLVENRRFMVKYFQGGCTYT